MTQPNRRTAAQKRELRQRNINLEYEIRAVRRAILNAQAEAFIPPQAPPPDELPRPINVAMSGHALEHCESMQVDPAAVRALVANPGITYRQRENRLIAQHSTEDLAAIYHDAGDTRFVVTVLFRSPFSRRTDDDGSPR